MQFTILELSGHLIDTLTLAKVIVAMQDAGVSYQVNDFQVGHLKEDTSTVQISVWADERAVLDRLMEKLRPFGAVPVDERPARLMPCEKDGVLPQGAYVRWNPPTEVLLDKDWVAVRHDGCDLTIVVDPVSRSAELRMVAALRKGDCVAVGGGGIKVLPLLPK